jgi:outer membrane protein
MFQITAKTCFVVTFACASLSLARADFEDIDNLLSKNERLAALKLAGKGSKDDQLYAAAYTMLNDGQLEKAEQIFKRLIAKFPASEHLRLGLIRALLAQKKTAEAASFARQADTAKLDGVTANNYAALIKSAVDAEKPAKRSGLIFSFNAAPTTNVTGGSTVKTVLVGGVPFTLDPDSLQKSGLNTSASMAAYHTLDVTKNLALRLKGGVSTTINVEAVKEAEITASTSADFLWKAAGWSFSMGPVVEHVWRESDPELWRYGGQFSLAKDWKNGSDATFRSRLVAQDYITTNIKDGYAFYANVSYGRIISPVWRVEGEAGFSMEKTRLDHLDYAAYSGGLELTRKFEFGGDFFVAAGVDLTQRDYKGKHPLSSDARHDTTISSSVSLAHSRIKAFGITPKLIYEYSDTQSNIDIYSTNAHTVRLAINKSF